MGEAPGAPAQPAPEFWRVRKAIIAAAPVKVWARRLGVHRVTVSRALSLDPQLLRLRQRLVSTFQSLQRGEWRFIPPPDVPGNHRGRRNADGWTWEGETPDEREQRLAKGFRIAGLDEAEIRLVRAI